MTGAPTCTLSVDYSDGSGWRAVIHDVPVPPRCATLIDQAVADLADDLGLDVADAALDLAVAAAQRRTDTAAYHREATRRGVLPL